MKLINFTKRRAFLILCALSLVYGCSTGSDEMKQVFSGKVVKVTKVKSAPNSEEIKSVNVKLDSGKNISIFIKEDEYLNSGDSVEVFRYPDHPNIYYLSR